MPIKVGVGSTFYYNPHIKEIPFRKKKKQPGNLHGFKLLTFATLELAVPIKIHVTVVGFQLHT